MVFQKHVRSILFLPRPLPEHPTNPKFCRNLFAGAGCYCVHKRHGGISHAGQTPGACPGIWANPCVSLLLASLPNSEVDLPWFPQGRSMREPESEFAC